VTQRCPVCAASKATPLGPYRNDTTALAGLTKHACVACGMVFVSPMPSQQLWDLYNASYFQSAHGSATDSPRSRLFREGLAGVRVRQVLDHIGAPPAMRILEVGAGYGEFMQVYQEAVPGSQYAVVDTDASAREMLRQSGAEVFAEIGDVPNNRDLLVLSHVLEHTRDPVGFLLLCLDRLRPGAHVFIDVPCRDDLYKAGDEPHLLFFDKPAMQALLTKVGLRDIDLGYFGQTHAALTAPFARHAILSRLSSGANRALARMTGSGPPHLDQTSRVVLAPFAADQRHLRRARWLRAIATK
jgi:SAM-dependent methyltransferase